MRFPSAGSTNVAGPERHRLVGFADVPGLRVRIRVHNDRGDRRRRPGPVQLGHGGQRADRRFAAVDDRQPSDGPVIAASYIASPDWMGRTTSVAIAWGTGTVR